MKTENLFCHRCGSPMTADLIDESTDGYGAYWYIECPHCGAVYEVTEPTDEEKKKYEFWKDEDISKRVGNEGGHIMNDICINCGEKVFVGNNFMYSDYDEEVDEGDDKMNYCLNTCSHCGCDEVRWDTSENDKQHLDYWKSDK